MHSAVGALDGVTPITVGTPVHRVTRAYEPMTVGAPADSTMPQACQCGPIGNQKVERGLASSTAAHLVLDILRGPGNLPGGAIPHESKRSTTMVSQYFIPGRAANQILYQYDGESPEGPDHPDVRPISELNQGHHHDAYHKPIDPSGRQADSNAKGSAIFNPSFDKHEQEF